MNFSGFFTFLYYPDLTLLWLHMVEATIKDLTGCSGWDDHVQHIEIQTNLSQAEQG